jgi:hypothetical protein
VYAAGKTYADLTASGKYSFTPDGRIAEMRLGNNLWETRTYLPPGPPTLYKLGTSQRAWNLLKLEQSHKASVFRASLGLTLDHAEDLRSALLAAALKNDATPLEHDEHDKRYVVDLTISGPSGEAMARSGWIILRGEDFPRLTSRYVL